MLEKGNSMPATKPKKRIKPSLAAVVAHPLRARALGFLNEFTASPRQMATAFGEELGKVSYQVRVLLEMEKIELVDTRPVRGATEHFYRAVERPWVNLAEWEKLSQAERNEFAMHVSQLGFTDAAAALSTGKFSSRTDNVMSRYPFKIDEEGWKELFKIHDDVMYRVAEVELKSDERRKESGEPAIDGESFVLFFPRESDTDWMNNS
jgi:DNA-binding transcriptional ArsR family regulator